MIKYIVALILVSITLRLIFDVAGIHMFPGQDWAGGLIASMIFRFMDK